MEQFYFGLIGEHPPDNGVLGSSYTELHLVATDASSAPVVTVTSLSGRAWRISDHRSIKWATAIQLRKSPRFLPGHADGGCGAGYSVTSDEAEGVTRYRARYRPEVYKCLQQRAPLHQPCSELLMANAHLKDRGI